MAHLKIYYSMVVSNSLKLKALTMVCLQIQFLVGQPKTFIWVWGTSSVKTGETPK
jgi:hypothetical protein